MIATRWAVLALFFPFGVAGCGPSDASKLPASDPTVQQRSAQIERFKARPVQGARKPGR